MISNPSTNHSTTLTYPSLGSGTPFSEYITHCRETIESRRTDLNTTAALAETIINANSPYEFYPANPIKSGQKLKYGVLLVHGLLDCPFSMRDVGMRFQAQGMLCRSVLLPGHGTVPSDLLHVSYQDWIQTVRYGIETFANEVEQLYLVGYSTGAALSVYHALQDERIAGILLMAPAIRLKSYIDFLLNWRRFLTWATPCKEWIRKEPEIDYTKYISIPFNPVLQVTALTNIVADLVKKQTLKCPIFMAISREDETISSHDALTFFASQSHPNSRVLLYTPNEKPWPDSRMITRTSVYPPLNINHFAHVAIPFAPDNNHYGQQGDYPYAAHFHTNTLYGAYNPVEVDCLNWLYRHKLLSKQRGELTYNPDFDFMANSMVEFISGTLSNTKIA